MVNFANILLAAAASITVDAAYITRRADPLWLTLPPTPALPSPISADLTPINGVKLWMQKYNEAAGGTPIVLVHGGLGHSAYFGSVIDRLVANNHYVIALDRRGHGRSTYNTNDVFTFDMFAQDTYAHLKSAGVDKYIFVGWSDGAITGLASLLNSTMAAPIQKAFLFGTTATPADSNATFGDTNMFSTFVSRVAGEWSALQPTGNFTDFATKVSVLEATLPNYTDADLGKIDGSKVTISDADHEEAVNMDVPARLNKAIVGSKLVTLTGVSHFAPVQDPDQFTKALEDFLKA